MRYDKSIYFQKKIEGKYDADTGNYLEDGVTETLKYGNVQNTSLNTLNLAYNDVSVNSLTITLQNHYNREFDRIRVGEKIYEVSFEKKLPVKHVFIAKEVL